MAIGQTSFTTNWTPIAPTRSAITLENTWRRNRQLRQTSGSNDGAGNDGLIQRWDLDRPILLEIPDESAAGLTTHF